MPLNRFADRALGWTGSERLQERLRHRLRQGLRLGLLGGPLRRWLARGALLGVALGAAAGCGAVSASTALNEAGRDLREAQQQQADKFAPYHYTRAETYLRKAKELNGMGQYQVAGEYARVSQEASTKSLEVARVNKEQAARREKFAPKKTGSDNPPAPKLPGE